MAVGVRSFSRYQSGTETTPGTPVAATRIELIEPDVFLKDDIEFHKPDEARNSLARNYRSIPVKRSAEISGMKFAPTFERFAGYMQAGAKGGVTATADAGTPIMYTYTFKRSLTANDLKHFTWELGDNIQCFQVAGCALNRWEVGFTAGGPMTGSMDWLGLAAAKTSFTGSLSDPVVEDINGANAVVYIDDTTIQTTLAAYPIDWKFSHDNKWSQLRVLNGQITPKENLRPEPGFSTLDGKIAFDTTAEYDKFVAHTLRKIRLVCEGTVIHDAIKKALLIDWYGYWDAYDMGSDGGVHVASIKGESHVDTTFASDWQVVVKNALAILP